MKQSFSRSPHLSLLVSLVVLLLLPFSAIAERGADLMQTLSVAKSSASPAGGAADLIVSNINMSPGKPNSNDQITVWTFVKNVGPVTAPASSLQLQVGGKLYPPITAPPLKVNQEWCFTTQTGPLRAWNYQITATVNPQHLVAETNYDNNKRIRKFTVAQGPQVFIRDITWNRSTKVWVAEVKNTSSARVEIGVTGFPLENGVSGMTKWANTSLAGYATFELRGDYSSFNVPAGTRLKVRVIKKGTNTMLDEKVRILD